MPHKNNNQLRYWTGKFQCKLRLVVPKLVTKIMSVWLFLCFSYAIYSFVRTYEQSMGHKCTVSGSKCFFRQAHKMLMETCQTVL